MRRVLDRRLGGEAEGGRDPTHGGEVSRDVAPES